MSQTWFTAPDGREWDVLEFSRSGAGARAEGDPLPEPTQALLRFESEGEIRWVHGAPLDWNQPEKLAELFKRAER